jgi:2-deoxy-D-gluconate 3-dehydrogenase
MKLFDLTGRKALVTGGTRGIGYAMTEALLEAGADAALVGTSATAMTTAEKFAAATGRRVVGVQADLSDRGQVQRAFDEAVEKLEGLDILVVNHGINRRHPVEKFPIEDWDLVLEVNLTSMFLLNQLAGRSMLAQGHGKIINVASLISFGGGLTIPAYAAAKGGVAQLTKACANEWAGRGVNVNAVVPGYIATDLNLALRQDPDRYRRLSERIPAGRWGQPEDLKGVTIFLASAASDYIHGTLIPVDGGWLSY